MLPGPSTGLSQASGPCPFFSETPTLSRTSCQFPALVDKKITTPFKKRSMLMGSHYVAENLTKRRTNGPCLGMCGNDGTSQSTSNMVFPGSSKLSD